MALGPEALNHQLVAVLLCRSVGICESRVEDVGALKLSLGGPVLASPVRIRATG